jgi:hypothetical protein
MRKPKRAKPASRPTPKGSASGGARFELLGNEALGGHRARKGFRFQDLWIAFHLLDWVTQDDFDGFVNEGLDDVDARWLHDRRRGAQNPAGRYWERSISSRTPRLPQSCSQRFSIHSAVRRSRFPPTGRAST